MEELERLPVGSVTPRSFGSKTVDLLFSSPSVAEGTGKLPPAVGLLADTFCELGLLEFLFLSLLELLSEVYVHASTISIFLSCLSFKRSYSGFA